MQEARAFQATVTGKAWPAVNELSEKLAEPPLDTRTMDEAIAMARTKMPGAGFDNAFQTLRLLQLQLSAMVGLAAASQAVVDPVQTYLDPGLRTKMGLQVFTTG